MDPKSRKCRSIQSFESIGEKLFIDTIFNFLSSSDQSKLSIKQNGYFVLNDLYTYCKVSLGFLLVPKGL